VSVDFLRGASLAPSQSGAEFEKNGTGFVGIVDRFARR